MKLKPWLVYVRLTYSFFSRQLGSSSKSGKHSPDSIYTESCQVVFALKIALYKVKQVVVPLVLIYFGRPRLSHAIKKDFIKVQAIDPEIC